MRSLRWRFALASPGVPDDLSGDRTVGSLPRGSRQPPPGRLRAPSHSTLRELEGGGASMAADLVKAYRDGRIKMHVLRTGLRARRATPELFLEGRIGRSKLSTSRTSSTWRAHPRRSQARGHRAAPHARHHLEAGVRVGRRMAGRNHRTRSQENMGKRPDGRERRGRKAHAARRIPHVPRRLVARSKLGAPNHGECSLRTMTTMPSPHATIAAFASLPGQRRVYSTRFAKSLRIVTVASCGNGGTPPAMGSGTHTGYLASRCRFEEPPHDDVRLSHLTATFTLFVASAACSSSNGPSPRPQPDRLQRRLQRRS